MLTVIFSLLFFSSALTEKEHIIKSNILGYSLKYWVHVPKGYQDENLPVLFVTDGEGYKGSGNMPSISQRLISKGQVIPHIIVFVSATDPNDPSNNRRNSQFLCNPDYLEFYKKELIPKIDRDYSTDISRENRGILGTSFGGLNSMYFAIHGNDTFGKVGIQSPAPHPCPDIYPAFEKAEKLPIEIFLSTGTVNDKARETRRLKSILDTKGYDFKYVEVAEGHNWKNWKPLLDDVLIHFYGID